MSPRPARLDGITPILSMPFDDNDEIVHEELLRQVDFLDGTGIRAVGFGFGSEITKLTDAEALQAIRTVVEHCDGRVDVMGTVGGSSVVSLLKQGAAVAETGIDILMMRPPAGASSADMVCACVARMAELTGLPLVIQDAQSMTGVPMPPSLLVRLVEEVPRIIALKLESAQPARKIGEVAGRLGGEVSILGGAGGLDFIHELRRGSNGTVPFTALAGMFVEVQRLHDAGRVADARRLFHRHLPLLNLSMRSLDTPFWFFKELLRREGVFSSARLRAPHEDLDLQVLDELDLMLDELERGH